MHHHGYTIGYFLWNGLKYGAFWGALFGTLVFPLGGQFGLFLGIGLGGALGLLIAIAVCIYNAVYFTYDTDLTVYRRRISRAAGVAAALVFLPIFPAAPLAGLAAAHTAHRYAGAYTNKITKHKRDKTEQDMPAYVLPNRNIHNFFLRRMASKSKWLVVIAFPVFVGHVLRFAFGIPSYTLVSLITEASFALATTAFIVFADTLLLTLFNAELIIIVNCVYFNEYHPDMPLATYKNRIGWIAGIATLFYGVVITGGIFAPVAAFLAAWTARQYAEYRYATPEKAKNKAKHDAVERLQLPDTKFDGLLSDDVPAVESVRQQK